MRHNKPIQSAIFKLKPSDFVVNEILATADNLSGQGEHLWLHIQKCGVNTAYVVKLLAEFFGISGRDIGYSGLKDRHALTSQWFSLRLPTIKTFNQAQADKLENTIAKKLNQGEYIKLLHHAWHHKKLNHGTHKCNHFRLILRQVVGKPSIIDNALVELAHTGVPNFFGKQRFGNDGANLNNAKLFFEKLNPIGKHKKPPKLSYEQSLLISAVRSHLFNQILAIRVADNTWGTAIDGDVFNLNGTGSLFVADIDDTIITRLQTGDIHPTAPLFGIDTKVQAKGKALQIEQHILESDDNARWIDGLTKLNIKADRRALRMIPQNLTWDYLDSQTLMLDFVLPTGSFATSLLDYLVMDLVDGVGGG